RALAHRHGGRSAEPTTPAAARRGGTASPGDAVGARAGRRATPAPPWLSFLQAFDVEFRRRRLAFMIQGQNRLYAVLAADEHGEARRQVDGLKRSFYMCLDRLRRYDRPELYRSVPPAELRKLFATLLERRRMTALDDFAEAFAAENEPALTSVVARLAAEIDLPATTEELDDLLAGMDPGSWSPAARREVLVNYVGFPFWDVLTMAVTSWRDLGEFDEVRVTRISPEDAPTLARMKDPPALKGTSFMHFGAFFSRAFRENDYLLGRVQTIDRIIDIVCDSAGAEALSGIDVAALKRRAFELVL